MQTIPFFTLVSAFSPSRSRFIRCFLRFVLLTLGVWGGLIATSLQGADLVINEVMTKNDSAYQDTAAPASYDDWVELYNKGSGSVALAGKYLTDDISNPTKWQFPSGVTALAASSRVIVWCDDSVAQGDYHTNFKLSDGETLYLIDSDGVSILDQVELPNLAADTSYGRIADGDPTWDTFTTSSGNTSNGSGSVIVDPPTFEVNSSTTTVSGYFSAVPTIKLSSPDGGTIYYTVSTLNTNDSRYLSGVDTTNATTTDDTDFVVAQGQKRYGTGSTNGYKKLDPSEKNSRPLADDPTTSSTTVTSGSAITSIPNNAVTVVRAKVVKNSVSSRIITRTFFVGDVNPADSEKNLPTLPMVSFTMNSDDLWKFTALDGSSNYTGTNGLMIYGPKCTEAGHFSNPADNGNFNQNGALWERAASVEYFKADGTPGFSGNVTARVFGGFSDACPKRSFAVELAQGDFDYFFPNDTDKKYKYDGLVLHGQAQNRHQSLNQFAYAMNKVAREGVAQSTLDMTDYEPCLVYINGMYWGVYRIQESKGSSFIKQHYGYDSDEVDMWNQAGAWGWESGPATTSGTLNDIANPNTAVNLNESATTKQKVWESFGDLKDTANSATSTTTVDVTTNGAGKAMPFDEWFTERVDALNMIDCFFWEGFMAKTDDANKRFFRPRTPNGRWRWIGHDYDSCSITSDADNYRVKNFAGKDAGSVDGKWITGRLVKNVPELRNLCLNRANDLLNTVMLQSTVLNVFGEPDAPAAGTVVATYKPEIERDWFRWNGTWTGTTGNCESDGNPTFFIDSNHQLSNWVSEMNLVADGTDSWAAPTKRPKKWRDCMREELTSTVVGSDSTITLETNDAAMGGVRISTITPVGPAGHGRASAVTTWSGIYYQKIPVTISAQPMKGYKFTGWSGASTSTDPVLTFTPSAATHSLKATFAACGSSEVRPFDNLRITEIAYNPADKDLDADGVVDDGDLCEFVEIKNIGSTSIPLTGLRFTKGIDYAFRNGATLDAGKYILLVRNRLAFDYRYKGYTDYANWDIVQYEGALSNSGDTITLVDGNGDAIESFAYNDSGSWPVGADGGDYTLNRTDETADKGGQAESWAASEDKGGTPGSANSALAIPKLVVSEVSYHTDSPNKDTVEIYNPTGTPVSIANWYLTDDKSVPQKFKITSGTVPANGYLTIAASVEVSGQYKFGTSTSDPNLFEFSEHGEEVYLFSGDGTNLTGYSNGFAFDAAHNADNTVMGSDTGAGSTSIPYETSSTDGARRVIALAKKPTLGAANSDPLVGPVVISEIMYNGTSSEQWVEVKNITNAEVKLYDPDHTANTWKVEGLGFTFPTSTSLAAGEVALLIPGDPAAFRTDKSLASTVKVFQYPATASLDTTGETLTVQRPGVPEPSPSTFVPYYTVDKVSYKNVAPWPTGASGTGKSIERIALSGYGDDAGNWQASASSGGTPAVATASSDTTAPANTSGWPKADTATSGGFTVRAKINEAGTAYYVVVADGATAPSVTQVKAGNNGSGSAALKSGNIALSTNIEGTATVTGLSANTAYDLYVVAQDDESTPNVQSAVTKVDVSTASSDTTAPTNTSGWPKADTANTEGFTVRVKINEAGTAYYVVVATGSTAPSSAQVKAGQNNGGSAALKSGSLTLTANAEGTGVVTGLSANTAYDLYVVAQDDESTPNLQTSATKVSISTTSADTTAPTNTSGWPKTDTIVNDGFTLRTKIDEAGTAYYVVVADGAAPPSTAQVKAGQDNGGSAALKSGSITLTANTEGTAVITGLSLGTAYDVYVVAQDSQTTPNLQSSATKVDASTSSLIVYEKADYTAGTTKPDADGGANSGNGYPASGTATTGTGLKTTSTEGWGADITVASEGLTYADTNSTVLAVGGKALTHPTGSNWSKPAALYSGVSPDPFASYRATADKAINAAGKEVWISFLMKTSDTSKSAKIYFRDPANTSATNRFILGLNSGKWSVSTGAGNDASGVTATANTTALLLAKITYGANVAANSTDDKVELWVNPSLTGTLGTPSGTYSGMDASLGDIQIANTTAVAIFDELRIGNSQSSVLPYVSSDTTAPVNTSGWPTADTATGSGFTVRAKIDEAGTAYYVVVADGATAPSAAQVKAGNNGSGSAALKSGSITLSAATEGTAAVTGLSAGTAYDVYVVAQDDESTPNVQASVTKVDITTLTPIQSWRSANFSQTASSGDAADTADPDGDGIVNLLEYALTDSGTSLDPDVASTAGLPNVTVESSKLKMAFKRNTSATDVKYEIEASTNLTDWTPIAIWQVGASAWSDQTTGVTATDSSGTSTITDSTELTAGTKRFLRLKVTAP